MDYSADIFKELEKNGVKVNEDQKRNITNRINSVLSYEPKVGIFGKTGVGKSSLCNSLFGKDICQISDVEACTREAKEITLGMGQKGIKLLDVPGVGESSERDAEYAELYAKLLPELDVVLWLLKGDDRAFSSDEAFYKNIVKTHLDEGKPFFFVLNQVDKIEPFREWDIEKREPGAKQFQNIHRKVDDVAAFFGVSSSKVIPVSANEKFNLTKLVDEMVFALPRDKKITLFREVSEENRSEIAHKEVKKSFLDVVENVVTTTIETAGRVIEKGLEIAEKIIDRVPNPFRGGGGGGCFITTATCEILGKEDDCYELTLLRRFRDEWLIKSNNGENLIKEYYEIAPKIVNKINKLDNRKEIYMALWNNYISKCVELIEVDKPEESKNLYIKMVNELKDKYCNGIDS